MGKRKQTVSRFEKFKAEVAAMPEAERKEFIKAWGEPEELHHDLLPYQVELERTGTWVKHPLVFSMMHDQALNGKVNKQYALKVKALAEAEDAGKWITAIWLHERPHRFEALERMQDFMGDEEFWEAVSAVWTDSENIWQHQEEWEFLLSSDRPGRESMMEEGERAFLRLCPPELKVYRGINRDGRADGLSWTHDRGKAEWFANYLCFEPHQRKIVVEGTIRKDDILAIFDGRDEFEVVAFPESVFNRTEHAIPD